MDFYGCLWQIDIKCKKFNARDILPKVWCGDVSIMSYPILCQYYLKIIIFSQHFKTAHEVMRMRENKRVYSIQPLWMYWLLKNKNKYVHYYDVIGLSRRLLPESDIIIFFLLPKSFIFSYFGHTKDCMYIHFLFLWIVLYMMTKKRN